MSAELISELLEEKIRLWSAQPSFMTYTHLFWCVVGVVLVCSWCGFDVWLVWFWCVVGVVLVCS